MYVTLYRPILIPSLRNPYTCRLDEAGEGLDYVFEGIVNNSIVDHVVPHIDGDTDEPRLQLNGQSRAEYNNMYEEQLRNIIEGYEVFEGEEEPISFDSTAATRTKSRAPNKNMTTSAPALLRRVEGMFPKGTQAGQYSNWKGRQNVLKGGINHQHPHCDNAIVNSYANLDVFPFVCIHGFGVSEFSLWLLPNPLARHYGFLHTFQPNQMVIMRGDFVHAGAPGLNPRAHMELFPRESAGWTRKRSF